MSNSTNQYATVSRYCAIEDTQCDKAILYKGPWTYFFAYPGSDKWRDFTAHLHKDLSDRGFNGERWEDIVQNELLFSKVCDGIYSNDFLLAEVTEPNANVMLEIGYALAVGREPILLKNTTQKEWSRTLLTTLESCYYETRDDIIQYITKLHNNERHVSAEPNRRLPLLESMGIFDDSEIPRTVYHLKPKLSADWISKVTKTLDAGYFKLSKMDISDSATDEFYTQAREIQRASVIVASLVSSQKQNSEQHNSNVALLIGFAIGLGKRVLVLHENPQTPILDLGTIARSVDTESQAQQIVKSWIEVQRALSLSQRVESDRRAHAKEQVDLIRKAYLGHPDALQDNRLLDYFVPTKEFNDAVEGHRNIFIGRKGSGKSANFQAVKDEFQRQLHTYVVAITPDDFELEKITEVIQQSDSLVNQAVLFQHVWNYVLISEAVKSLAEDSDLLYQSPDDSLQSNLHDYYQANQPLLSLDFGSRVAKVLRDTNALLPRSATIDEVIEQEEALKSLREYQVARMLRDFAIREGITYKIIADDLDKHWHPDSQQSIGLLLGLVEETSRLQRFFREHLSIVMFLKEDIYDVLVRLDDNLSKRNIARIEWTNANLKHLVAERLANTAGQSNEDDDSTWSIVFPHSVNGIPASEYILGRALPRPRDVLDFCQKAIDQAQRNGHSVVTEQDILDGELSFSESVFWSVSTEYRGLYPNLEDVLIEFAEVEARMTWTNFEQISRKAISQNRTSIENWLTIGEMTPIALAEILFKVGILGFSNETSGAPHFSNGRSFAEQWRLVAPSPTVHVHPAFAKFLDIASVRIQSPILRRRPRAVDPRQLRLDESP